MGPAVRLVVLLTALAAAATFGGCTVLADLWLLDELDCDKVPPDVPEELVRSCVLSVSCGPFAPDLWIGECISNAQPLSTAYHGCLEEAESCDDVEACTGLRMVAAEACAGAPTGWHCDGDVAVRCDAGNRYSVDCAVHGATCTLFPVGVAAGSTWPCALPVPDPGCEVEGAWHCAGDELSFCALGTRWGRDCAATGRHCLDTGEGPRCQLSDEVCDPWADLSRCEGHTLVDCTPDDVTIRYDCAAGLGACNILGCVPAGCEHPAFAPDCEEDCLEGTTMRVCVGGDSLYSQALEVDCADYGFTGCAQYYDNLGYTRVSCL